MNMNELHRIAPVLIMPGMIEYGFWLTLEAHQKISQKKREKSKLFRAAQIMNAILSDLHGNANVVVLQNSRLAVFRVPDKRKAATYLS